MTSPRRSNALNFRFDMMWSIPIRRPSSVVSLTSTLGGIEIREDVNAVRPVWRVVKSHPRARRKRYSVQRFMEPCAIRLGDVWFVHPKVLEQIRARCA
jgi:hypothetical protein